MAEAISAVLVFWQIPIFKGLAVCAASLVVCCLYYASTNRRSGGRKQHWREVGKISHIFTHPVKACRGIELKEAECTALGMKSIDGLYDRRYMILNNNDMVTMRQNSTLALIHVSQSEDGKYLQLDAPDMSTLKLPINQALTKEIIRFRLFSLSVDGYCCGEEATKWLDTFLKCTGHKLVCYHSDLEPRKNATEPKWGSKAKLNDKSVYQDLAQYNLFSIASLDDLNTKLEKKVTVRNFRPNFVVSGPAPYEEDLWKYVRIGENVTMRVTHLCGRCKQITVDPDTGVVSKEPMATLRTFRTVDPSHPDHKPMCGFPTFGINLNIDVKGVVAVGDIVYVSD